MVGFYTDISQIKALESQLLENEKIYSDFFENTKSANIIYATDDGKTFTIKELNSQVETLEGIKKEDIIGKRIDDVFKGVEAFGFLEILKKVYETGEPYKMPLSLYKDKDLAVWRENYIFKLSNGDIVASYEDKTQEKRLDLLLSNTINSVDNLIFVKDMDSNFIECNTAFEKFMGRSRDELIGKSDYDFFEKELADYFRSKDKEMLTSAKPQTNYEWVTFPDGSEVYLLTVKSPLRDAEGNILGLVGNAVDVTSQYNTQREIAKLKSALDRSPISIMMTDIHGNIEYVNPNYTRISGYSLEELLGENPRIVKSGYTSDEQYRRMWKHISSGHIWSSDIRNIAKDGTYFWENSTILPTFNDGGEVDGYIAFKLDITDKVNMQRELMDKEELMVAQSRHAAMGEMISMIAHQWRQPITVIAMGANNMIADIELQDMNEDNFRLEARSILEQTQHLSKTIDDFRDFFRPNKDKEDVYINDIMSEAVGIIGKSLEHSNIALTIENTSTTTVKLFSRELLQVFMNLLKNAKEALVEHTPHERQITVTIQDASEKIITTICDNGGGIDEAIIDKIFNPYFSTKNEQTGTGLGLYMSKTIIDKHLHGSITPTSKDGTTCFEIIIPLLSPKEAYHKDPRKSEEEDHDENTL
jgi:PAS domain S-box-containing protein